MVADAALMATGAKPHIDSPWPLRLCQTTWTKRKEVVQLYDLRIGTLEVAGR